MNIRLIPLLAALLPFLAVHLTYVVAASYDLVDWCVPYIDSCTSISATGRHPPASYLFRALMLPSAVIMMAYWWLNHSWLLSLHNRAGHRHRAACHWMLLLGIIACIGLIIYVTVLGEPGSLWARQRRIGTVLFFSFTYIAQLLLVSQLRRLRRFLPRVPAVLLSAMFGVCLLLLGLGILTVLLDAWDEAWYKTVDDAFEWVLSLLLQSNFLLGYFVWRYAGWQLRVSHPALD
jgi:Frag1/DRAM/Sfk1 family protein